MSAARIRIGLHGAMGRMGLRLIQLISEDPRVELVAAIDRSRIGEDAGVAAGIRPLGVPVRALEDLGPANRPDVVIDFSHPSAVPLIADYCRREKLPLVVGTTGLEAAQQQALEQAAAAVPVLASPNMSRAVNLLMKLVSEAASAMGPAADVEIVERHHKLKKDSPSGTAIRLAELVMAASGADRLVHGREGQVGERTRGEIGMHAVRAGDCPGEHTVLFALGGDTLELTHRALNRDGFVRGAIDAAVFLAGKSPGSYAMRDVLESGC
ncbi:4-hydroxy-tetrahydrodipicolinate reductase [Paludisphaera rhizosphaerae]|uniref:4-hydroxy-tetrahydrodipicolinate reductase n=1 Tax=Paludisphaera rhizosphaerae TaxID=2711216 RepID=UPI0013EB7D52|nr:4-hydroxy-tetrahydrodipicolinate reductase [Paludisphaera rhizosphaerae]